jgi:hypothetical protein
MRLESVRPSRPAYDHPINDPGSALVLIFHLCIKVALEVDRVLHSEPFHVFCQGNLGSMNSFMRVEFRLNLALRQMDRDGMVLVSRHCLRWVDWKTHVRVYRHIQNHSISGKSWWCNNASRLEIVWRTTRGGLRRFKEPDWISSINTTDIWSSRFRGRRQSVVRRADSISIGRNAQFCSIFWEKVIQLQESRERLLRGHPMSCERIRDHSTIPGSIRFEKHPENPSEIDALRENNEHWKFKEAFSDFCPLNTHAEKSSLNCIIAYDHDQRFTEYPARKTAAICNSIDI